MDTLPWLPLPDCVQPLTLAEASPKNDDIKLYYGPRHLHVRVHPECDICCFPFQPNERFVRGKYNITLSHPGESSP